MMIRAFADAAANPWIGRSCRTACCCTKTGARFRLHWHGPGPLERARDVLGKRSCEVGPLEIRLIDSELARSGLAPVDR